MEKIIFTQKEIIEALERSGYLLESEISIVLNKSGFVTENNQVIVDPHTGKSREIDLTAELFNFRERISKTRCVAKIRFVFEIKNNAAPVVLLTKFEHSPNLEDWLGLKRWITIPKGLESQYYTGYWDKLILAKRGSIFTQYCSFQRKKGSEQLMALHPDNLYEGLSKITQFCEEAIDREEATEPAGGYWRDFLYIPVVLLNDDLYELHNSGSNKYRLKKVQTSILVYNYHFKNEASMAYIYIVTKKGLQKFIDSILKIEEEVETEMIELRNKKNDT